MRYVSGLCALGLLVLSGCSSSDTLPMPTGIREKFTGPTYKTRIIHADQRKTYDAAKAALKQIGFRFLSGGPNQGKLSGIGDVSMSTDMRGSRQVSLDVKLSTVAEGTEVALLFSEIIEDDFNKRAGLGTTTPLRDTPLYQVYFRHIEEGVATAGE
jgi:hypothetical protein